MRIASIAVLVTMGAIAGGCAAPKRDIYVNPKATRYDTAITLLDCQKAEIVARKRSLGGKAVTVEARRKAWIAGNHAARRCVEEHGYKRRK